MSIPKEVKRILIITNLSAVIAGFLLSVIIFRDDVDVTGWMSCFSDGWVQYRPIRIEYEGVVYDCVPRQDPIIWNHTPWPDIRDSNLEHLSEQHKVYSDRLRKLERSIERHKEVLCQLEKRILKYREMLGFE